MSKALEICLLFFRSLVNFEIIALDLTCLLIGLILRNAVIIPGVICLMIIDMYYYYIVHIYYIMQITYITEC